jgi:O-methyltransferase involved in polyketide biosynthesis
MQNTPRACSIGWYRGFGKKRATGCSVNHRCITGSTTEKSCEVADLRSLRDFGSLAPADPARLNCWSTSVRRMNLPEITNKSLGGVAETLFLPLYIRAMESQRPDALIKDDQAVALTRQMDYDPAWIKKMMVDEDDKVTLVLRNLEFDRYARGFLARCPEAVVVHVGCGLDSRFDRVDNGKVEWYDLDLPQVIELRRELIGGEGSRYHFLAYSAFDSAWLGTVSVHRERPVLFLAEGVLMYFEQDEVKSLVLMLREHFPGAELVFDAFSPYLVRMNNLRIGRTKIGARYQWGLKRGKDLEDWSDGITLLDEWFPFSRPEPRLAHVQWMRHIPLFAKIFGIFHYRLGKVAR